MQTGPMEPSIPADINRALMLDGNAVAGLLEEVFSHEMTTSLAECGLRGSRGKWAGRWPLPRAPAWCCAARAARMS